MTAEAPRGRFITFEGGEGCGKSTQVRRLVDRLNAAGVAAIATREPGGSPGAEDIRQLLVTGAGDRWDGMTEALLAFAARRDHLRRTIWPALAAGTWVVCDRFADSTRAYQGAGRGLGVEAVETLYRVAIGDFAPDMTLILDLPVAEGLRRAAARAGAETRFEDAGLAFHETLARAFHDIARREPSRCKLIDASGSIDMISQQIVQVIAARFGIL